MEIKEAEAIKAAEILRQYCKDVLCPDCIFNFRGVITTIYQMIGS